MTTITHIATFLFGLNAIAAFATAAPECCQIAQGGKAKTVIILGTNPCDASKNTAKDLADMLGKISGVINIRK